MSKTTITVDVSDASILWICSNCNIRVIDFIQNRENALLKMRKHRDDFHGLANTYRMVSTTGNPADYKLRGGYSMV